LQGLSTDNHFIPSVHIEYPDNLDTLLDFVNTHTGVMGTFTPGVASAVPGDVMAPFSSRGGPGQNLGISKPDITAPGVQILAGHTPMPATVEGGLPGELFQAIQGTSMSSPHIAGAAALLADMKPTWTPGQIKSAMMLSAWTNVLKEDGTTKANPFDTGSGRIDLTRAGNAGLTMDESIDNYFDLQGELWNANYPSLYVPNLSGSLTVQRTVKNEANQPRNWKLTVKADPGLIVSVPNTVQVPRNGTATFDITVSAPLVPVGQVRHATLSMKQGNETLLFPITVVRGQASVLLEKECEPTTIAINKTTNCTITLANTGLTPATVKVTDTLPQPLLLVNNSLVGATKQGNGLVFNGTLPAAEPPDVAISAGAAPFGYVPLAAFGVAPIGGFGDESIVNFNVPQFTYGGMLYDRMGMVSNGYLVVGGGAGADIQFINQNLPDPARPNNVLAPFWTDLNPGAGGALRVAVLGSGANSWIVFEWTDVPNWSNPAQVNTFQVWVPYATNTGAANQTNITYAYGPVLSAGDGGFLTVGAENQFGNRGDTLYFDGFGTLPVPGGGAMVTSTPPTAGGSHVIEFSARGRNAGPWTNCANMTGNTFPGTAISCVSGEVVPPGGP
jgi:uncharacterized repeat protein (TIGR01451 family)